MRCIHPKIEYSGSVRWVLTTDDTTVNLSLVRKGSFLRLYIKRMIFTKDYN
jgi:hypothetical protein